MRFSSTLSLFALVPLFALSIFGAACDGCAGPVGSDAGPFDVDSGFLFDAGREDGGQNDAGTVAPDDAGPDDAGPDDAGNLKEDAGGEFVDGGVASDGGQNGSEDGGELDGGSGAPDAGIFATGLETRPVNAFCVAPPPPPNVSGVVLERVHGSLNTAFPLLYAPLPGTDDRILLERRGQVLRFQKDSDGSQTQVFLDVRDVVYAPSGGSSEAGLLGLAFHPDFIINGKIFVHYMVNNGGRKSRLSSFTTGNDGNIDRATEVILLEQSQPADNHNGGDLKFGPDGFLYASFGDGGGSNDQFGNGQDPTTLLGSILRLDVDNVAQGDVYSIPADNPFAQGGGAPEIFAWGLRNVWRFSFDKGTGLLYAGDVGQNRWEEIDIIEKGGNYGWNEREGKHCFPPESSSCEDIFEEPIWEYPNSGGASVTGGYVYRGANIPSLIGKYVFADFVTGKIWALSDDTGVYDVEELLDSGKNISSFAEDENGELYAIDYAGSLFRFVEDENSQNTFPSLLSQTGCFLENDPKTPVAGLIPYDVNVALWSDGAVKDRFMAIPDGTQIGLDDDDDFVFPVGTVLAKHFRLNDVLVETRLFMRHDDVTWGGYVYKWNEAQTDATLLPSSLVEDRGTQDWIYPSRGDCLRCHTEAAGRALGPEVRQLKRLFRYPSTGRRADQIDTLLHIGWLADAPQVALPILPDLDDVAAPLFERAAALLHVNCSGCHRPGVASRALFDARFYSNTPNLCDVDPQLPMSVVDIAQPKLIAPGDRASSVVYQRVRIRGQDAMPAIGSALVDDAGVELIGQWIDSLNGCP